MEEDLHFGELAAHYLMARSRVQELQTAVAAAEEKFKEIEREVRDVLDKGRFIGRAAGSYGAVVAKNYAWWADGHSIQVLRLNEVD